MTEEIKYGPTLPISEEIHAMKYRGKGESFKEAMSRVAYSIKDSDEHYHNFRDILLDMRFLPAGRVQSAMGSPRAVTPYNCLSGDTEIITSYGVMTLLAAHKIMGSAMVLDGNGEWVEAPIYEFGEQNLIKVRLTNGKKVSYIKATPDHEWVIEGREDRVTTANLKKGMRVPHVTNWCESDDLAVLHGLVYGDGSKTKDGGHVIHVCSEHEATYPILDKFDLPYSETERGRLYYMFGKNNFVNFKELPDKFVNDQYVAGFIRGLFLADGCITKQPEYIITGTAELMDWLGDYGPVGGFYVTGASRLQDKTNFGVRTRDTYNIRFDLRSINQGDCLKGVYDYDCETSWRVDSFESTGPEVVYCPSVPTTMSFVLANGALMGNCFVSGTIEDSINGINLRAGEAAQTMRMGGGIGYDFSTLRPQGSLIKSLDSPSSGPIAFMGVFDAWCKTISSAGNRRGAQMGVLRVDHPDIESFIEAKANSDKLTQFNISIAVTDEFMEAVQYDRPFTLKFNGVEYKTISAKNLWEKILRHTWDWAEPGILFIDRINQKNNLHYCETIAATNPLAN